MLAAVIAIATCNHRAVADGAFVVVVNDANSITSLCRAEVKRAATGGIKQWESGAVIQLGISPGDTPETQYLGSLLDLSLRDLLARLQEQVFQGEMRRPVTLRSSAECAAFAPSAQGGVYVAAAAQPLPPEVHVVAIQ